MLNKNEAQNFRNSIEAIAQALASMNQLTRDLKALNTDVDTLGTQLVEETTVAEAEAKTATVADVEEIVERQFKNQFAGFVEYGLSDNLKAGKVYSFCIHTAKLINTDLQLVVLLYAATQNDRYADKDKPEGLIVQNYRLGSFEYREMVKAVYSPLFPMLVAVKTDDIEDVFGAIELKECNGKLHLDWTTFCPEQTPCGSEWYFSKRFLAEMQ